MSLKDTNKEMEEVIKLKIDKLKETINESLGLSNIKLIELEKELHDFETELHSSSQSTVVDQTLDSDKLMRLYKAERSLTDVLQQKIISLEKDITEKDVSYKAMQSTENLLNNIKDYLSSELSKLNNFKTSNINEPEQRPLIAPDMQNQSSASIENIITNENKQNKEERQRLQNENQDLQKELHYYQEKNESLRKELQFRNQEILSYKKIFQEQEEEEKSEESYFTKKTVNDEYHYTLDEEFDLTKEELETLKNKFLTLEKEQEEKEKLINNYKQELTDLKRILGEKNTEIRHLKRNVSSSEEIQSDQLEPDLIEEDENNSVLKSLQEEVQTLENELIETQKQLNIVESQNRELTNGIKKLEEKRPDKEMIELQLLNDKLSKAVWKIEKNINIFDSTITADAETFNRHIEVYGLLLGKLFNAKGYAQIIDTLLKHKGKALTKKMVMNESKTEPHIAIRVLRDLHDSKIIHLDEELDQIIWRPE